MVETFQDDQPLRKATFTSSVDIKENLKDLTSEICDKTD